MAIFTVSGRDFNQDVSKAKRTARRGPVFITNRGHPAHVLLTIEEYRRITKGQPNILDQLAMPGAADVEFDPPELGGKLYRAAEIA